MTSYDQSVKEFIDGWCSVAFSYCNMKCGIETTVDDGKVLYQSWIGDKIKYDLNADDAINDKFFNGQSFNELIRNDKIDPDFY